MKPHNVKLDPSTHFLIATVGLPYSGKSTWIDKRKYSMGVTPIVSPDAIRAALGVRFEPRLESHVWAMAETMIFSLFKAGHNIVIFDSTATTVVRRKFLIRKYWTTHLKVMVVSPEVCKERAIKANDEIMCDVIDKMAAEYEAPTDFEGAAEIERIMP